MSLVSKRDAAKKAIKEVLNWIEKNGGKAQLVEINTALNRIETKFKLFQDIYESVMEITGSGEIEFQEIELEDATRSYNSAKAKLNDLLIAANAQQSAIGSESSTSKPSIGKTNDNNNNTIIMRNTARAIERMYNSSNNANIGDVALIKQMLDNYWNTYSIAAFSYSNLEEGFNDVEQFYMNAKRQINQVKEKGN